MICKKKQIIEQQISILKLFLRDHVTLKIGVMKLTFFLIFYKLNYTGNPIVKVKVLIRPFFYNDVISFHFY